MSSILAAKDRIKITNLLIKNVDLITKKKKMEEVSVQVII